MSPTSYFMLMEYNADLGIVSNIDDIRWHPSFPNVEGSISVEDWTRSLEDQMCFENRQGDLICYRLGWEFTTLFWAPESAHPHREYATSRVLWFDRDGTTALSSTEILNTIVKNGFRPLGYRTALRRQICHLVVHPMENPAYLWFCIEDDDHSIQDPAGYGSKVPGHAG